jgi:hypothetical protein
MASLRISQLATLIGSDVVGTDLLAIVDLSASETKNIDVSNLAAALGPLFPAGGIPGDKVDFTIPPGSIGTTELADKSVTAPKLANSSTGLYGIRPATGEYIGQICVDNGYAYMWDGTTWRPVDGPNAIIGINYTDGPVQVVVTSIVDNVAQIQTAFVDSTQARQFIAGPTANPGTVTYRQIVGADLPTASATEQGAVQVAGGGLTMNGTLIEIDNSIAPSNGQFFLVDYDEHGLVVDSRVIEATDLPVATDTSNGVIRPGTGLTVTPDGVLNHTNATVGGTYTKVTVDNEGHVNAGGALEPGDIPELSFDQITSGEIGLGQLGECAVTAPNICDYATCLMQEDNPGAGAFLGQFWYTPSTAQLRVYARGSGPENIWLPVGFGALQANNLRWGGTYDADTDTLVMLTAIGVSEGLTAGQPFPAPTDQMSGIYFICQVAGNNCSQPNINNQTHTAGDWALCIDQAQGWIHIDANAAGGGGGGGAQYLDDLLDVEIGGSASPFGGAGGTEPTVARSADQILRFDGDAGLWRNTDIIDGGSID